jgi:ribosomal protein S18 acetylase RimI-like enzyme
VIDVLALAFAEVPLTRWLVRAPDDPRLVRQYVGLLVAASGPGAFALRDAEGHGAALWVRPGAWRGDLLQRLRHLPRLVSIVGPRRCTGVFRGLSRMAADHPDEPHYYLELVGVRPAHRGCGLGGALLRAGLERADAEGRAAYLHTSNPAAVPLYRRFGFEVARELRLPAGGPAVVAMRRAPR